MLSRDFKLVTVFPKPGDSSLNPSQLSKLIECNQPKPFLGAMLTYLRTASSGSFMKSTNIYQTICHVIEFWEDPPEAPHEVKSPFYLKGKKNHNSILKLPPSVLLNYFCIMWSLFFFFFRGPHPQHMEVPWQGVKSELQLPAYTTATASWDLSCIFNLHHSSRWRILNPLREARDQTHVLMDNRFVPIEPQWELHDHFLILGTNYPLSV